MIVVARSEREETQEDKIKRTISILTYSWSPLLHIICKYSM
jgi:hypothetical protein